MNTKIKYLSLGLVIGLAIGFGLVIFSHNNHQKRIDDLENKVAALNDSRYKCVELNKIYNQMYQGCMVNYYQGNKEFESAVYVLQEIAPKMHSINAALKLDCTKYDETTGKPVCGPNGDVVKILPETVKVEETRD